MQKIDAESDRKAIGTFYDTLSEEKDTFTLSLPLILSSYELWAAKDERGEIIALAGLRKKWACTIFFVVVKKTAQGKGLGKSLTKVCFDAKKGLAPLLLSVDKTNKKAQALYESLGMAKIYSTVDRSIMMQKVGPWRALCFLAQFWLRGQ